MKITVAAGSGPKDNNFKVAVGRRSSKSRPFLNGEVKRFIATAVDPRKLTAEDRKACREWQADLDLLESSESPESGRERVDRAGLDLL